jgi:methionyl-tRNA formyltransferase
MNNLHSSAKSLQRPLNTVFFGTPDFSLPSLEMLHYHPQINLTAIVSGSSKPVGRGAVITDPPVVTYAKTHGLKFFQSDDVNRDQDILDFIVQPSCPIDLIIVLAFGQFLHQKILRAPRFGAFNIHTSLLPKFRGAAPIQHALLAGEKTTGVTIQKMAKKMDAGEVAIVETLPLAITETGGQLATRLKFLAPLALNNFISHLTSNELHYMVQDETQVSFAPTLQREDGKLNFSQKTAAELLRQIRAFDPWPGTYCLMNQKRLKVWQAEISQVSLRPGEVGFTYKQLHIGCQSGSLRLEQIQLEGKKRCSDEQFVMGLKDTNLVLE